MQVLSSVIQRIPVDVVDDFAALRSSNAPMLPLAAAAGSPHSLCVHAPAMMSVASFHRGVSNFGTDHLTHISNHPITAPHMLTIGQAIALPLVGIKRVSVLALHLIVALAKTVRDGGPLAVLARSADLTASPPVIGRSMPLHSFVVHQAKIMRGVTPGAAFNAAHAVKFGWGHSPSPVAESGKSVIGRRIEMVEALQTQARAA